MILLNTRFKFGKEIKTAEVIDATNKEKVRINGTEFFKRKRLTEKDLENLKYKEINSIGWNTNKPLTMGKYKVTYNQADYFMSYIDELDLFNQVVQR